MGKSLRLVLPFAAAAVLWTLVLYRHAAPPPAPVDLTPRPRPPVPKPVPRSIDQVLADLFASELLPVHILKAAEDLQKAGVPADGDLREPKHRFRAALRSPLPTRTYDVLLGDYTSHDGTVLLQPLKRFEVMVSQMDIDWFDWVDDSTIVYSTRNGVWAKPLHGPERQIVDRPVAAQSYPALSADRTHIAVAVAGGIVVSEVSTSSRSLFPVAPAVVDLAWSPHGKAVAFSTRDSVFTLDPETGRVKRLWRVTSVKDLDGKRQPVTGTYEVRWSPDGRFVSVSQSTTDPYTNRIVVIDAVTGRVNKQIVCWMPARLSWSPDSRAYAYADSGGDPDYSIFVQSARTDEQLTSLSSGTGSRWDRSAWSSDGRHVAFEFTGTDLEYIDDAASLAARLEPSVLEVKSCTRGRVRVREKPMPFAWSPRSEELACVRRMMLPVIRKEDFGPVIVSRMRWTLVVDGVPVLNTGQPLDSPRWSPDGTRLAVLSGRTGARRLLVVPLPHEDAGERSAARWLNAARVCATKEDSVVCLQNAVRLSAAPSARLALADQYLQLASSEPDPYWRLLLLRGVVYEVCRTPLKKVDDRHKHALVRAVVRYGAMARAASDVHADIARAARRSPEKS